MADRPPYDVFLSYSAENRPWAAEIAASLREQGVHPWLDASEIRAGEDWKKKIEDALRESSILVLLLGRESVASPWTFFEIGAAIAGQKRIIPVLREDAPIDRLPPVISRYPLVRESSAREAGKRIANVLRQRDAA